MLILLVSVKAVPFHIVLGLVSHDCRRNHKCGLVALSSLFQTVLPLHIYIQLKQLENMQTNNCLGIRILHGI